VATLPNVRSKPRDDLEGIIQTRWGGQVTDTSLQLRSTVRRSERLALVPSREGQSREGQSREVTWPVTLVVGRIFSLAHGISGPWTGCGAIMGYGEPDAASRRGGTSRIPAANE